MGNANPQSNGAASLTDTHTRPNPTTTTFADLGLPAPLCATIARQGFTHPTPIQEAAIPALLDGEDIVGVAQTGTGKTAAYGLPLLASIRPDGRRPQALVLVPTRELAIQVASAIQGFAADLPQVRIATIYGGASFVPQKRALELGVQVVVGTPGRIIDHLERRTLDLGGVGFVVMDEGDEMLRMGFAEDVDRILAAVPVEHQTALCSATMPSEIRDTARTHLRHPRQIAVTPQSSTVADVDQRFAVVPFRQKVGALIRVLATSDADAALVFVRTRADAQEVGAALAERDVNAAVISGEVSQPERERIVERLRSGRLDVLVATDVAARGLDVERVGLVVNFDLPREPEAYVHRIGRTGRAGRSGVAISFVTPRERDRVWRIQKATRSELVEMAIPTPAEVTAHRIAAVLAKVPDRLAGGRLHIARQAVDDYLDTACRSQETGPDATEGARLRQAIELATALAALAVGDEAPFDAEDDAADRPAAPEAKRRKGKNPSREDAPRRFEDAPRRFEDAPRAKKERSADQSRRRGGYQRPAKEGRSGRHTGSGRGDRWRH